MTEEKKPESPVAWAVIGVVLVLIGGALAALGDDRGSFGLQFVGLAAEVTGAAGILAGMVAVGVRRGRALSEWDKTH